MIRCPRYLKICLFVIARAIKGVWLKIKKPKMPAGGPSLALDYFVNAALCSCCDGGSVGASIRGGGEMTDEKLERRQREREAMRQAIAAYTGPITKCPPGTSPNVLPRRRQGEQKKTPTGSSENTP